MIGLSASFCAIDIATGKVDMKDVVRIVSGTFVQNRASLEKVIKEYREWPWDKYDPDKCEKATRQIFASGKLVQPRVLTGDLCFQVPRQIEWDYVFWIQDESQIVWKRPLPNFLKDKNLLDWEVTVIES